MTIVGRPSSVQSLLGGSIELPVHNNRLDMSVPRTVSLLESHRLSAKNTFNVPSVTMNGGSFRRVTSAPLRSPQVVPTPNPISSASSPGTPWSADSLAITIDDNTMMAPTDRSMPAVRMISVWPIAMTPTTITCCRIRERFSPVRKRSVRVAKKRQATARATKGPSAAARGRCFTSPGARSSRL